MGVVGEIGNNERAWRYLARPSHVYPVGF